MTTASDAPDSAEIPAQDDLAIRASLGPYELKRKLGQGGMGAVYLAVDPRKKEQLALKILPREKASNPQLVKRFKAEAQNAAQLSHENIVAIFGTGEDDGYLYIALEFIDGIDVHDLIQKRGVLPVKRSIDIIKQVSRALQHALEQHIVHRDIKPANLLVRRDGVVKLADMGLARAVDESIETGITRAGTTVGTVDYMSPEQARNSKAADVRSDIYSLGCTWYHMLTGRPPFAEGSLTNKLNAHAKQPPPDARDINPNVPEGVVAVMQRMMAKNPDDRYQSPQELIDDLEGTLVNKDAVSRQILEGIMDDLPEPLPAIDASSSNSHVLSHAGRSPAGSVTPATHTADDDDVYSVRAPIISSETSVATASPSVDDTPRPAKIAAAHLKSVATPLAKVNPPNTSNTANSTTSARKTVEVDEPAVVTKPLVDTTKPSHSSKHQADEPVRLIEMPTRPAAAPTKGGKPEKAAPHAGPTHTMPPPRRRTNNDEPLVTLSSPISPKKLATTIGSIAAILVIIAILSPWIKKAFTTEEPVVVSTNPFEGPAAPPVPATGQAADIPLVVDGANQGGAQQTVKSVLTERKDLLANSTPTINGVRPANIGGSDLQIPNGRSPNSVEWMDQPLQSLAAPIFNIRKGQAVEVERQYPVLQDAIKKVAKEGGRLVLFHEGPFELAPVEFTGGIVIIEAAAGVRPRIRLVKDNENNKPPGIKLKGASLVLDGVDIVSEAGSVPASIDWTWFDVDDGHIYVKRSSLTLSGHRDGSTTAFKLSGRASDSAGNSRFLLDETVLRGEGLQTVQFESHALDAVIRNSLVIAGDAGCLTIRQNQKASADATRKLRIVDSTLSTRQRAFTLRSADLLAPIATEIVLEGSLVSAPEPATQSVLLRLEDWPQNKSRVGGLGPFKSLIWNAKGSAVLGFNSLVSSTADASLVVNDANAWRELWKESAGMTISSVNWPQGVRGSLAETELKVWSPKTLEALQIPYADTDHIPGCRVSKLRTSDSSGAENTAEQVKNRPRTPIPFASKFVQQVDIAKVDLGKLIASKTWEDGTVFIVNGSGTRPCSPILIEGRKIRVKFNQTEGPTLVIAPKAGPKSGEHLAFITVRGGQLDVEQGTFDYDTKDSAAIAPWFMHAENAGFSLRNCRIKVPANASRSRGLVHWTPGNGSASSKSEGEFSAFGEIVDSVLVGNGTLMAIEMANMAFVSRNSAYIARQNLFEVATRPGSNSTPSAVDVQNCTYLVAGTQFVVNVPGSDHAQLPPIQMFHQDCIFATLPAEAGGKASPLMMNVVGSASPTAVVTWNEESCGYGPDLKAFYLASPNISTSPVAPQGFNEQWVKRWGERAIQHPLTTSDGVLFEKNLTPMTVQIKPENLTLHKSAKARKWSETGGQLGVRPEQLEVPPAPVRSSPNSKKPGVPTKQQPGLRL
jgi:serine/threonine protein kinase